MSYSSKSTQAKHWLFTTVPPLPAKSKLSQEQKQALLLYHLQMIWEIGSKELKTR